MQGNARQDTETRQGKARQDQARQGTELQSPLRSTRARELLTVPVRDRAAKPDDLRPLTHFNFNV
jgi:hypothetical protein